MYPRLEKTCIFYDQASNHLIPAFAQTGEIPARVNGTFTGFSWNDFIQFKIILEAHIND